MDIPPDIAFYEAFEEEAQALRRHLPPDLSARFTRDTIQEAGDRQPPAAVISIRTQSIIPGPGAARLRGILSRSTGYDHLAAYRDGVQAAELQLGYLPLYCNRAVAEHAMMLWMALLRRLPRQLRQFAGFQRDGLTGAECRGRTLLVVGVGHIGHEIVDLGRALGMRVLGVDPLRRWDDVTYVSYEDGAPQAEVLVAAMNLTPSSRGFFDQARLERLRPGALFINIARGELADAAALLAGLERGHLAGVGLDVYDQEPELAVALRAGNRQAAPALAAVLALSQRDDVVCTPHNAFNTRESVERKSAQSIEQLQHLRRTGRFLWPVP
jgi:D-lactate dehydrogenase